jgi:hypothetical protein
MRTAQGTFDAAGNATAEILGLAPSQGTIDEPAGQPLDLSVTDYGVQPPSTTSLGHVLMTRPFVQVASARPRNPRAACRITRSGTDFAGQPIYASVTKGVHDVLMRQVLLGTANVCGYLSADAVVAPRPFGYRTRFVL